MKWSSTCASLLMIVGGCAQPRNEPTTEVRFRAIASKSVISEEIRNHPDRAALSTTITEYAILTMIGVGLEMLGVKLDGGLPLSTEILIECTPSEPNSRFQRQLRWGTTDWTENLAPGTYQMDIKIESPRFHQVYHLDTITVPDNGVLHVYEIHVQHG